MPNGYRGHNSTGLYMFCPNPAELPSLYCLTCYKIENKLRNNYLPLSLIFKNKVREGFQRSTRLIKRIHLSVFTRTTFPICKPYV